MKRDTPEYKTRKKMLAQRREGQILRQTTSVLSGKYIPAGANCNVNHRSKAQRRVENSST